MNKEYRELRNNTLIIAVANLGTKIIAFVLAPLYSYYMSVSQYGTMDIITSTVTLVAPFLVLDIYEATFRYSSDATYDNRKVFSTSIVTCIPGLVLCTILVVCSHFVSATPSYFGIACICIMLNAVNYILMQYLRGSGKMVLFAASGIVASIALLISNYILLVNMRLELNGWLYSYLISCITQTAYLIISTHFFTTFSFAEVSSEYLHEFIAFCMPLLPTAIMWWVMSLSDRYMLAYFIGTASTGLYAVANKLPNMLSVFESIFYQAWQTTAINTLDSKDRDKVYSSVFNNYLIVMIIGVLGMLVIGKPMIDILFEQSYSTAYLYIPVLVIAVVLHALNGNLGSLYSVFKSTKGALYSTILGALTNIILNCVFIPVIGVMGASLTTAFGYLVTLFYRWFDTKRFVNITLDRKPIAILVVLTVISLVFYYVDGVTSYIVRALILVLVMARYSRLLKSILRRG